MSTDFFYSGLFNFGLPLEDIFPPNQIHPRLQLLIERTFVEVSKSPLKIDSILKGYQGSLDERIALKKRLLAGKLTKSAPPTGAWLWLIRHFLGLLPLPLFPRYTDGKFYDWDLLAVACKSCGLKKTDEINKIIERNIANLPKENVMLIVLLMAFFRKISCYYFFGKQTRLDKYAVIAVVKYFSSSLFLRPYTPGHVTNKDRLYFPLTFYLIYNWLSIDIKVCDEDETNFGTAMLLPVISEEKIYVRKKISEESVESDDNERDAIERNRKAEHFRETESTLVDLEPRVPSSTSTYISKENSVKAKDGGREKKKIVIKRSVEQKDKEVETQRVSLRDLGCQVDLNFSAYSFANPVGSYTYLEAGKSKSEPYIKHVKRSRKKVENKVSSEKSHEMNLIYETNRNSEVEKANDAPKSDCQSKGIDNFKSTPFSKTPNQKFDEFFANIKPESEENHENSFSSNLRSISDTFLYEDVSLKATTTSSNNLLEHETSFYEKLSDLNRSVKDVFSRANRKINRKLRSKSPAVAKTKSNVNLKTKTSKLEMLKKLGLPISNSSPNVKYRKLMTL